MITLRFARPGPLMSMNDREHWRAHAAAVKTWRHAAWVSTFGTDTKPLGPSVVRVWLPVKDARKRDPHNYYPTVKAIVDGLVDGSMFVDDSSEHVTTIEPVLQVRRDDVVTVTIEDRT